eukprot:309750_1
MDSLSIIILSVGIFDGVIFIICIYYISVHLKRRAKEPKNTSWCEAVKQFGFTEWVGIILETSDIGADYFFAADLIVTPKSGTFVILGWISLFIAVVGVIVFICKYMLLRKLLGVQIKRYRDKLNNTTNDEERESIMKQIRTRKMDIGVISLL